MTKGAKYIIPKGYVARISDREDQPDEKMRDLMLRRTRPFIEKSFHHSLDHILQECYLQGFRDAVETMRSLPPLTEDRR